MYLLSAMGADADYTLVARNIVLVGLGMGTVMPCFNLAAQNAVGLNQLGVVTSLVQFLRSIGGTIGATLLGSTLVTSFAPALQRSLDPSLGSALPPGTMTQISNPQALLNPEMAHRIQEGLVQAGPSLAALYGPVMVAVKLALTTSLHWVFLTCGIILTAAAIGALFLPDRPLRGSFAADTEGSAARPAGTASREAPAGEPVASGIGH
jgi:hypothetical protein